MMIALLGDWATAPVALVAIVDVVVLMPIAIGLLEASRGETAHWLESLSQVMRTMVVVVLILIKVI